MASSAIDHGASLARGGASASAALVAREWIRLARQPSRVVAALGTAAVLWIVLGSGLLHALAPSGPQAIERGGGGAIGYAAYVLPGMAAMIAMFSSIFAAMSLIEDRRAGVLRPMLASAMPTWSLVLGKALGCASIAFAQSALVLAAVPVVAGWPALGGLLGALGALALMALGLSGMCLALAWIVGSSEGFHGVMNLVLMPMWLLSGSVLPVPISAAWMQWTVAANPLSWPVSLARASLYATGEDTLWWWMGSVLFAAGGVVLAWWTIGRARSGVSAQIVR